MISLSLSVYTAKKKTTTKESQLLWERNCNETNYFKGDNSLGSVISIVCLIVLLLMSSTTRAGFLHLLHCSDPQILANIASQLGSIDIVRRYK